MKRPTIHLSANKILIIFCLYCLIVFNLGVWQPIFQAAPWDNPSNRILLLTMPTLIFSAMFMLLQLFFLPKIHRVVMPLLLVLGAGASYAVMTQGVFFDADQVRNVIQTDPNEARAYMSVKFIAWIVFTGILPAIFYVKCVRVAPKSTWYKGLLWRVLAVVVTLAYVAGLAAVAYQNYASFFRNNRGIPHKMTPINFIAASARLGYKTYDARRPFEQIGLDAKRTIATDPKQKTIMVVVVGETTRAQNWGLNPNAPATTPQLAKMSEVINFPNVSSCGTATAVSLPCLFSPMNRTEYKDGIAKHQENVLDILQRVGYHVSWQENDSGCKDLCKRIPMTDTHKLVDKSECHGNLCYDRSMLKGLKNELAKLNGDAVIVLHTNGSHGPAYFERYPPELALFKPTCDTNQIQDCRREELVNTYNNTVVGIDDMLAKTIALLKEQTNSRVALWYFSDHGESLGEKGIFLHGTPYAIAPDEQTRVPMIFWANDAFYTAKNVNSGCLKQKAQTQAFSHDNFFPSLLGLMDVQTSLYNVKNDMFQSCRTAS